MGTSTTELVVPETGLDTDLREEVNGKRYYRNSLLDGRLSPSVTTVLWRTASESWQEWANKIVADFIVANIDKKWSKKKLLEEAMKEPARRRQYHADIGTRVHEMRWTGEFPDYDVDPPEVGTAMESWYKFREEVNPTCIWTEKQVVGVCSGKDEVGFGGTPDDLVELPDGRIILWDVKTSREISPGNGLQVAAYAQALPDIKWDELWVLRLGKYVVGYQIERIDHHEAWLGFQYAHGLYTTLEGGRLWV